MHMAMYLMGIIRIPSMGRLPDFLRTSWVSTEAYEAWHPRINKIVLAWSKIESHSVKEGLRRCALSVVSPDDLVERSSELIDLGLSYLPLAKEKKHGAYGNSAANARKGEPFDYRVVIGEKQDLISFRKAWNDRDDIAIGELLGYPDCCQQFFSKIWVSEQKIDTTWDMFAQDQHSDCLNIKDLPIYNNLFWRWMGVRTVSHLPCSKNCQASMDLGASLLELGSTVGYKDEINWIKEILSWPINWSSLNGIAEIKTPILKFITNTDLYPSKKEIKIYSTSYPENGASGVNFPYTSKPLKKLSEKKSFQKGLAQNIKEFDEVAAWQYQDNGFPSKISMDRLHRPLLEELNSLEKKSDLKVLDLGCGNGWLLKKVMNIFPDSLPYGVDLKEQVIERAKQVHPSYKDNFSKRDIFDDLQLTFSEYYDVVFLMLGRLMETNEDKRDELLEYLSQKSDKILLYCYEDWLKKHGKLSAICKELNLNLSLPENAKVALIDSKQFDLTPEKKVI